MILLEAPVLSAALRLPLAAGLLLSVSVNLRSTLVGIVIAIVVDITLIALSGGSMGFPPSRGGLVGALVPMFLITWWIERRAVVRKHPELSLRRSAGAVLAANILSYAALFGAIRYVEFFKVYDKMGYPAHVYRAHDAAQPWQSEVESFWKTHKRFPERAGDLRQDGLQKRQGVRTVALEPGGRVVLVLDFPHYADLDGKRLIYEPRVVGDALLWRCRTPDLNNRYTPYGCREDSGAKK